LVAESLIRQDIDFRLKENRREAFIQWFAWSLINNDCDPALWMLNYMFKRYEFNIEQRLWVCWLYGTTYYAPTSWVIWNEFPDFELVGLKRLEDWNNTNYKRLRYQTDTKYNKGHLPKQFASYYEWVHTNNPEGTQRAKFESILRSTNDPFKALWDEISGSLYKFGRYSTWFYMQTLKRCAGIHTEPHDLVLKDDKGSKSHRTGLLYALGLEDLAGQKLDKAQVQMLETEGALILKETNKRFGTDADFYDMETCLCSFKKIFRDYEGRYLGYYLDRQAEEISRVQNDGWVGVNWEVYWQARRETLHPLLGASRKIKKDQYGDFLKTGQFMKELF
jgi:hypothetical protein